MIKILLMRVLLASSLLVLGQLAPVQAASQQPGASLQYISPQPGSQYNPPGTTVAIRYGDTLDPNTLSGITFHVSASSSGRHTGSLRLSDDRQTLIFKPSQPFTSGETVNVAVDGWNAGSQSHPAASFSFAITPNDGASLASTTGQIVLQSSAPAAPNAGSPAPARWMTAPADLPSIAVTVPATGTAPGLIFASNFQLSQGPSGYYLLILDNTGQLVYYQKLGSDSRALNFTELPDGTLTYVDAASNTYYIMDNSYRQIGTVRPGNGYQWLDEHDLQLLPNGHYLILVNEVRRMDLSKVVPGGKTNTDITAQVVQELDRSGDVVFQWRVLDNFPITATTEPLAAQQVDFSHSNAVALDSDGNLLLSSRHLDEVTKINRQTGQIMWHLGGKQNQFAFSVAPGVSGPAEFYHQHDVRRLPNGHITVFDNHNGHDPQVSRIAEYAVDDNAKTATLVHTYGFDSNPLPYALAMGNGQLLPNGDTFIGWGTNLFPNMTEVRPDGTTDFALDFGGSDVTYRAFRFPWHGYPTWPPAVVAQTNGNALKLTFSWNGATDVTGYRVYGGNTNPPNNLIAQQAKTGFEDSVQVADASTGYCFYQVVPVDAQGRATVPSVPISNPAAKNGSCQAASGWNSFWSAPGYALASQP